MTESIIATYDNVKFIEGITPMTQDNWQSYFSPVVQNGVYSGLEFQQYTSNSGILFRVTDGVAYVNGIRAELHTPEGYTDIGSWYESGDKDAFFCLRVYRNQEKAEIVKKINIVDSIVEAAYDWFKYTWALGKFIGDESYQCENNFVYYEIPLIYFGKASGFLRYGRDLRRMVKPDGKREVNPRNPDIYNNQYNLIRSNNVYTFETGTTYPYYIDAVNPPDDAIIFTEYSNTYVKLYKEQYINDCYCYNDSSYPYLNYENAYDGLYGLIRNEYYFKSGITHSSGSDSGSSFRNKYELITLNTYQTLHITLLEKYAFPVGSFSIPAYRYLVE